MAEWEGFIDEAMRAPSRSVTAKLAALDAISVEMLTDDALAPRDRQRLLARVFNYRERVQAVQVT